METAAVLLSAKIPGDSGYSKVQLAGVQTTVMLCACLRFLHEFQCSGNGSTDTFHSERLNTVFLEGTKVI